MTIPTNMSISGFIATDPQLTRTKRGEARFWAKVGQEHYTPQPDGTYTQTDTTFHDLVAFKKTAERAHARLVKGDKFIAEGRIRSYDATDEQGQPIRAEEFVATKIGHDLARTNYQVKRPTRPAPGLDEPKAVRPARANASVLGY
jgi:single-stranded DNA-binding protein